MLNKVSMPLQFTLPRAITAERLSRSRAPRPPSASDGLYLVLLIARQAASPSLIGLRARIGWEKGGALVQALHGWRVIEMESRHRTKIITCQALENVDNELHIP